MRITVTMSSAALRSSTSAIAIALFGVGMPQGVWAQETPASAGASDPAVVQDDTEATDEIVVTGLRQSLASAQSIKRDADQFVDSITAQDIGRLPDVNVAEALQRVSGVQITRNRGEGSGIAVRGLTQVRTELNGRDVFSASGGRGLSFEEVGSELLGGVDVYKNPSADLIEGGLSGTVNLRTRLPFDQPGQLVAATVGSTYYDLIGKSGQQASAIYSNRWNTGIGEIGVLANVGWQTTSFREDVVVVEPFYQHGPLGADGQARPGVQVPINGFEDRDVLLPHGAGFRNAFGERERLSGAAAVQWRPTAGLEFYAQYFRADYKFNEAGVSFFAAAADNPPAPDREFTVDEDGIVRTGYLRNPNVDSVNFGSERDTSTTDISGGFKWDVTERFRVSVDYQHIDSTVEQSTTNWTTSPGNPRLNLPGLGQDYDLYFDITGEVPIFQTSIPNYYANPNNYGFKAFLPYAEENDANADAIRADLSWDFGEESFIRDIRGGVRYTDKQAINRNTTYGTWTQVGDTCANWSSGATCYRLSDFPQFAQPNNYQQDLLRGRAADTFFGPVYQFSNAVARDPGASFDAFEQITGQPIGFRAFDDPTAFLGTIGEKTYAAYVRVGFGGDIGTVRFSGNVGVRAVRTDTQAAGLRVLSYRDPNGSTDANVPATSVTELEEFSGGRDYDKYLPSVNLKVNLTDELIIRAAFSKNFARPGFSQLNPQFNLTPTYTDAGDGVTRNLTPNLANPGQPYDAVNNPYVGTGQAIGDANLLPEEATSYDLAAEWYFDSVGFVYVTGFYKNIKNLLVQRAGAPVFQDVAGVGTVRFNVDRWINESEGLVRGFEVGGQKFFDFLPAPFDGLGVQANYTFTDSDAGVTAAGDINSTTQISVPLANLSKHSYNLVALYDKSGLNMRLAYNWRDDYLQGTANTGTQNLPIFGAAYGTLDASVTYDVTRQFAITVDGQNLLDTAFKSYQIFENRQRDYGINDRRFSVRARIRL